MARHSSDEILYLNEELQEKSNTLSQLYQICMETKQSLWEAEAQKHYLHSKSLSISPILDSEIFSKHLKSKYEQFKGTILEKVLLGLIKSYQQYKSHTFSLSVLSSEKEETLEKYKKITSRLSQESNLKAKLDSLQDYLAEKESQTNQMKKKLQEIRNESSQLKQKLDFGEVRQSFDRTEELKNDREKIIAEQKILNIELQSIQQKIETEQALGGAKTEDVNKMLRNQLKGAEKLVTDIMQEIKIKERKLARVKILLSNLRGNKKASSAIGGRSGGSKSVTISPELSSRNGVISMLKSGIDHKNFGKINKVMVGIGNDSQSFTSKIVLLNRGK